MATILHLTTVHPRTDTRIFIKEAQTLASNLHHKVFLMVADGKGNVDEGQGRVSIHDLGLLGGGRLGRVLIGTWRAFVAIRRLRPAIVHFHDPELIPVALLLAMMKTKVIYDVHEDVPRDVMTKEWLPRRLRKSISRLFEIFENAAAKRMSFTVAATPFIRDRFLSLGCRSLDIRNYPLLTEFSRKDEDWSMKELSVCYMGVISKIRGVLGMIEAAGEAGVRLLLAGQFEDNEEREKAQKLRGWSSVEEHGQVNREGVATLTARAMAGMVVLYPMESYLNSLPIKMFEYMAAGIPVIASDFPLWQQIVADSECGLCVDPLKPAEIATAIKWIADHPDEARKMGENGRREVEEKYNWEKESEKLLAIYSGLLN